MKPCVCLLETYLNHCLCEKRLNTKTVKAYRCDLDQFFAWAESQTCDWIEAEKADISAYIIYLNSQFSPASAKRKVASLRAFYAYCEVEKMVSVTPFHGFKISIREPKRLPRTIPLSDLNRMFESAAKASGESLYERFLSARDHAIIEVLIATGVRVSELCALDDADFDDLAKTLLIFGKGSKERVVQVENESTLAALARYRAVRDSWRVDRGTALFVNRFGCRITEQSVRNMVASIAVKVNASTRITPHMFRHTFATLLLEEDIDIRYIQRLLGHSSIKTTEIYTHVTSTKLRAILKDHNPRSAIEVTR